VKDGIKVFEIVPDRVIDMEAIKDRDDDTEVETLEEAVYESGNVEDSDELEVSVEVSETEMVSEPDAETVARCVFEKLYEEDEDAEDEVPSVLDEVTDEELV